MPKKTFIATLPDQAGTFLPAARIIAERCGNIARVSYNKAVDPHMLFIDVEGDEKTLEQVEEGLAGIGYLNRKITETRVIEVLVKIPDRPGAILPVLEILHRYDINISYMNSFSDGGTEQNFKFGLLIENPKIIKTLLDDISKVYPVNIIECEDSEENLDNTVFYIRLANEMQSLLGLSAEKTMQFISESNRMLQVLQADGEDASKVFAYIRRFAHLVSRYRGNGFRVDIQKISLSDQVEIYSVQPFCGSNTYVLFTKEDLLMIDTGYTIYSNEMMDLLGGLVPDWEQRSKRVYITHADVDHCGMLAGLTNAKIYVNQKSAENFKRQLEGQPDYREQTELNLGYSRISRMISGYMPPSLDRLTIVDRDTPEEHDSLIPIGKVSVGDLDFSILEGSGGHLPGEMVLVCPKAGLIFTGDILVNISGFSRERAEFNSLAPYLMRSVNVDSKRATEMRRRVTELMGWISEQNGRPCILCGGHGPVSELSGGKLISREDSPVYSAVLCNLPAE